MSLEDSNNPKLKNQLNYMKSSKQYILLTIFPAFLLVSIVIVLILHYETSYVLNKDDYREIWMLIRNLFNVFMLGIFIFGNINIFIKSRLGKEHMSYSRFIIQWFIALTLMNFSHFPIEVIKISIDALPIELGLESLNN